MARPLTKRRLAAAVAHIRARDTAFAPILDYVGPCAFEARRDPFMALVDIVAAQQVSKYAAESIRQKLRLRYGDPVDPAKIARARDASLRACSLSRAKIVSVRDLARGVVDGTLDFAALARLDDAAAIERLVALKGVGRWTAEIYLMFVLGRPDIFPIGDVALRKLMRQVYALAEDAPLPEYLAVAATWAPYRTVASWYLYAWINRRRAEVRKSKAAMTETLV